MDDELKSVDDGTVTAASSPEKTTSASVRKSGRRVKPATFADGTTADINLSELASMGNLAPVTLTQMRTLAEAGNLCVK